MGSNELPSLPNFKNLKDFLGAERKTFLKVNAFSEEDEFIRSVDEAALILDTLQEIQTNLWKDFNHFPSLVSLFNSEFINFTKFVAHENILEVCFIDDYIFPEKELLAFTYEGKVQAETLKSYVVTFEDWASQVKTVHLESQRFIKEELDLNTKSNRIECKCNTCIADYRARVREIVYQDCVQLISKTTIDIRDNIDVGIHQLSYIYQRLQKELDKKFFSVRYRLKRSSLNRLESQIKRIVKEKFTWPSDLAKKHTQSLIPFFTSLLREQGLRRDLLDDMDYEKFFRQLGTNIWRGEKYLEREFRKITKSVLMLKRKDISASILKEYLGEFWLHSSVRSIKRKIIYHMGPTNSGKTYFAIDELCKAPKGCYLAPLRLLAAELYDTMNNKGVITTLLTGEEIIKVEGSTHYSSTIEMARFQEVFDCCVIDEIQMLADPQRGWAWTRALVNIFSPVVHICGDPTALDLVKQIVELCGDTLEIKEYQRMTKLLTEKKPIVLGDLQKSDALIVFSRRNALKYKMALEQVGFKVSIVYGRLSPEVRREQARKFDQGETDIMVATDAIAMGMNLPIRRIVFSTLSKYIDSEEYKLTKSEIKQISGRGGRYKRFPIGHITCLARVEDGIKQIVEAMKEELPQKTKCMVGPDLDIFTQVNDALRTNSLPELKLSEFLRLFNTMTFKKPFYCVELKEMIELAEMVEEVDVNSKQSNADIFGFACAPVNLGMLEHVHYFMWIVNHFVNGDLIKNEKIDYSSDDIDYLETSIKCVELYQWLSRHFNNRNFHYNESELLHNKSLAIEKLNTLLSDKIIPTCSSCGNPLEENSKFAICEKCFRKRRLKRRRPQEIKLSDGKKKIKRKKSRNRSVKRRNYHSREPGRKKSSSK